MWAQSGCGLPKNRMTKIVLICICKVISSKYNCKRLQRISSTKSLLLGWWQSNDRYTVWKSLIDSLSKILHTLRSEMLLIASFLTEKLQISIRGVLGFDTSLAISAKYLLCRCHRVVEVTKNSHWFIQLLTPKARCLTFRLRLPEELITRLVKARS